MKKNNLLYYSLLGIMIFLTVSVIVKTANLSRIITVMAFVNKGYLFLGLLCMLLYWVLDALVIKSIASYSAVKVPFKKSIKYTFIGQYYNLITPAAIGTQPAQIYAMTVRGEYSAAQASSICVIKFILYHLCMTFYALILFIFHAGSHSHTLNYMLFLGLIGLVINCGGVLVIAITACNESFLQNTFVKIMGFLKKRGIGTKIDMDKWGEEIKTFSSSVNLIRQNGNMLCTNLILTLLQLSVYFSITYFVFLALGLKNGSYFDVIFLQSLLYMAVSFIPTPGNAGASEGAFYLIFKLFFARDLVMAAMVLWRLIVFYFALVLSGFVSLYDFFTLKRTAVLNSKA